MTEMVLEKSDTSDPAVTMQITCPTCRTEMLLQVGLRLKVSTNTHTGCIKCINCASKLIPLVSGPIVGGPFLRMHA
jgi:hypothetical protein